MFSKNAHLEVLGLTVPLRWFQEYQDLSPVENLKAYVEQRWRSLGRRLTTDELYQRHQEREKIKSGLGLTMSDRKSGFLGIKMDVITIAYQVSGNEIIDTYTRAQQETDALRKLGQLKLLEYRLEAGYGITFQKLENDHIDEIGGIYGLLENDYQEDEIRKESTEKIRTALSYVRRNISATRRSSDRTYGSNPRNFIPRK